MTGLDVNALRLAKGGQAHASGGLWRTIGRAFTANRLAVLGVGLIVGIGLFVFGIANLKRPDDGRPLRRLRPIVLGAIIAFIGLWRLGKGIALDLQARRLL